MNPFRIKTKTGEYINIGLEVCEDLWCEDYRIDGNALNVTRMLTENGADAIINISASPWTYGKNNSRDKRIKFLKKDAAAHDEEFKQFYYVNCVGAQNNGKNIITFDGGSTVYNSDAEPVIMDKGAYLEDIIIADTKDIDFMNTLQRLKRSMIAEKYDAILQGIRHTVNMMGLTDYPKFVIGLSGGVDSSVVAALLTATVGSDKIIGINMPTVYNQEKTKDAAAHVAKTLGIKYAQIPIQEIVDTVTRVIEQYDIDCSGKRLSDSNMENIQAKVRGTDILSNIAAKYDAVFTSNGNKLEVALGYATLYGDVGGAIAPIADLTKEEVFEMARYINKHIFHDEVIPETLLPDKLFRFRDDQIQPSAELKNNQVDPMKFGYHDRILQFMLDYKKIAVTNIMQWYIDGTLEKNLGISTDLIKRWNIDDPKEFVKDIEWFDKAIEKNVFKRVQGPPIIITSKTAFGYDLRESITPYNASIRQVELKDQILKNMTKYVTRNN